MPRRVSPPPPPGYRDVSIPVESLLIPGLLLGLGLAALALIPYGLLRGFKGSLLISPHTGTRMILALVVLLLVHELLHGLGWKLAGGFGWRQVSFGIDRRLNPYTHIKVPMTARAYRLGGLLPGLVTGVLPTLAGWIIRSGVVTLIGAFMLAGAVGDLIILWAIRGVPGDALVIDHPKNAGCWVQEV